MNEVVLGGLVLAGGFVVVLFLIAWWRIKDITDKRIKDMEREDRELARNRRLRGD